MQVFDLRESFKGRTLVEFIFINLKHYILKNYYLVIYSKFFVAAGGEVDEGGIEKKVEYTDKYNGLDLNLTYEEGDEFEELNESNYTGSEDGYNQEYTAIDITSILEAEYRNMKKTISAYNNL